MSVRKAPSTKLRTMNRLSPGALVVTLVLLSAAATVCCLALVVFSL